MYETLWFIREIYLNGTIVINKKVKIVEINKINSVIIFVLKNIHYCDYLRF